MANVFIAANMLRGLAAGITYAGNLILIRRFVNSKKKSNAIAMSCAYRLFSGILMTGLREVDHVYKGIILISLAVWAGILIAVWGPKKSKEREWDDYYESYFEQNNRHGEREDGEPSFLFKFSHFLIILGMRVPQILISNNVTKAIQFGFVKMFSEKFASFYFLISLVSILILLLIACKSYSDNQLPLLKHLILPCTYIISLLFMVTIPLIYMYMHQESGVCLLALIVINILIELATTVGLFYLLDTILVQSILSDFSISLVIALECTTISFIEFIFTHTQLLSTISLEGYYGLIALSVMIPVFLYHTHLPSRN